MENDKTTSFNFTEDETASVFQIIIHEVGDTPSQPLLSDLTRYHFLIWQVFNFVSNSLLLRKKLGEIPVNLFSDQGLKKVHVCLQPDDVQLLLG